jgi:hypothetical protein
MSEAEGSPSVPEYRHVPTFRHVPAYDKKARQHDAGRISRLRKKANAAVGWAGLPPSNVRRKSFTAAFFFARWGVAPPGLKAHFHATELPGGTA